ncbi:hypothetical protein KBY91_31835 [Streptomyces sp. RK23]|uniref:hypothetical protein n=1 Tax=unclassified Streptomyces TaxID=2593676 RepID=UPI001B3867AD|nr:MULTISPECIES: hypothetical protein [unclassified Streptomyces]MBQ0967464.1 hypothetical protein [Streptomyces sp. RK74B]MBQ1008005.1 hypothetical protein [Streptomyces sp. RK23]
MLTLRTVIQDRLGRRVVVAVLFGSLTSVLTSASAVALASGFAALSPSSPTRLPTPAL